MSRIHDMGGRYGDGAINTDDGPKFEEEWHRRALALTLASGMLAQWNLDKSRHARESLPPSDYTRYSYYEKWIAALANLLVDADVLATDDLLPGSKSSGKPTEITAVTAEAIPGILAKGGPADRAAQAPVLFDVGDAVLTRMAANQLVDGGHTRLPRYAAKARGRILRCHGHHVFPDSNAHGLGEAPEPLYAVAFSAWELWQNPEHPKDEVIVDLWQSYLEPG